MKPGHLSQYFTGVAMKRLSAVEANPVRSNQHEFNGVDMLKNMFGAATGKQRFPAKFLYLCDHDDEPVVADGFLTWYDAREKHLTRSEHRLYFPTTPVSQCAAEGDLLVIGRKPDASVLVVIAENGSTIANQIQWLFGFHDLTHPGFSVRSELENDQDRIEYASRVILEQLEVVVETTEETYLDEMLRRFGGQFPATKDFSGYARSTLRGVSSLDDPDGALMTYMDREEILFRTLERHLLADRFAQGFDIDNFFNISLSFQNRRKSRAGSALENHLETIFIEHGIQYSRTQVTENRSRPDFIFPGIAQYRNAFFDEEKLTMLGVKNSCKDRWRQVLAEADRIRDKHLLTLETSISQNQTKEMEQKRLRLVLPKTLHETYLPQQQGWLMSVGDFLELVCGRQNISC